MSRSRMLRFVVLQGLPEPAPHACGLQYDALAFQPRAMVVLVAAAAVAREPVAWAGLSGLLLLGAAAPRLNPFDAVYAALASRRSRRVLLPAARAPRRFAMTLAALFCLVASLGLLAGQEALAWGAVAAFGLAFLGIFGFGFCFGSWFFRVLVPSWAPPPDRPLRPTATGAQPVAGLAGGAGGHASSTPLQPVAGLAGGAGLRTPPRTPHASSAPMQPVAEIPADRV